MWRKCNMEVNKYISQYLDEEQRKLLDLTKDKHHLMMVEDMIELLDELAARGYVEKVE